MFLWRRKISIFLFEKIKSYLEWWVLLRKSFWRFTSPLTMYSETITKPPLHDLPKYQNTTEIPEYQSSRKVQDCLTKLEFFSFCPAFFFFFFFDLGFTALSRIFHLYRADRSSKVGENRRTRRKTTWPSVSRTWLSHIWPEPGSNHSGEKPNGLRVNSLIH